MFRWKICANFAINLSNCTFVIMHTCRVWKVWGERRNVSLEMLIWPEIGGLDVGALANVGTPITCKKSN